MRFLNFLALERTALRLALHILKQPEQKIDALADSIKTLRKKLIFVVNVIIYR